MPEAESVADEVKRRRYLAKQVVSILTDSDSMSGEERNEFVRRRMNEVEQQLQQELEQQAVPVGK
jgi:hypothetical protein